MTMSESLQHCLAAALLVELLACIMFMPPCSCAVLQLCMFGLRYAICEVSAGMLSTLNGRFVTYVDVQLKANSQFLPLTYGAQMLLMLSLRLMASAMSSRRI